MRLGLFGGGFKPFTTGHHSKLLLALETCDLTCVFWGLGPRDGVSRESCQEMFSLYKTALTRSYGDRLRVVVGVPSPITGVFAAVGDVVFGTSKSILTENKVDLTSVSYVDVFTSQKDLPTFSRCLGTPNEAKYFGDLCKDGRLRFITEQSDNTTLLSRTCFVRDYGISDVDDLMQVRATSVREIIRSGGDASRYIPAFLTHTEKERVISLMRERT